MRRLKYKVGDELFFRHVSDLEADPVRVIEVRPDCWLWPYEVENIGDPDERGVCSESELSPITAVGAGAP